MENMAVSFYPGDPSMMMNMQQYGAYPVYGAMPPFAPFPATPTTSAMQMCPDTTVKSGSEFGDTPPSSGSSNSKPKNFKSPEDEKRYKLKRLRNNEAAKKSRKSRKQKEEYLVEQNKQKDEENQRLTHENMILMQKVAQLQSLLNAQFNNENANPAAFVDSKAVAFQGSFGSMNSMNTHVQ